ncbi:hypothetical protein QBA75_37060 [Streptomyces stelliscabiei]
MSAPWGGPASAATPTLTVDLGNTTGAFRGGASGALYGLYGPDVPTNNLIEGMGSRPPTPSTRTGSSTPARTPWRSPSRSWTAEAGTSSST